MRAARSTLPVLLEGETGTGKTYLARTIHELGPRSARPFVRVDCAELAEGILERELFGHERGAYTDARESGRGLIEDADGGTLLLDEICDLPLSRQSKLLTFVEEGWIRQFVTAPSARISITGAAGSVFIWRPFDIAGRKSPRS